MHWGLRDAVLQSPFAEKGETERKESPVKEAVGRLTPRRGRLNDRSKDLIFAYALLLPAILVFMIVVFFPILKGIAASFCDYTILHMKNGMTWNNFENYKKVFANGALFKQLWNTIIFVIGTVGIEFVIGLGLALLLNSEIRGRSLLRSAFLIPWTVPSIVVAVLWSWMFQAQFGVLNFLFDEMGLLADPYMEWLQNPKTAMITVIVACVWRQTPYMIVMLLSGLQAVRTDLVEAAAMDGATYWQRLIHVILPSIKPVIGTTLITSILSSFQQFTIIYNMTDGGPIDATTTLSIATYKQAFTGYDLGAGSALGVIWLVILGSIVTIYNVKSKRSDD